MARADTAGPATGHLPGGVVSPPTLAEVDDRLEAFRATLGRITENLIDLDADVTRQMLEASSSLSGKTAEAWSAAQGQLTGLWEGQLALSDTLEALTAERGTKASVPKGVLASLLAELDGPSVAVASPDEHHSLTGGVTTTTRCTVDDVVTQMSADYDAVTALIGEVTVVWTEIAPRLDELSAAITDLEAVVEVAGVHRPNELAMARGRVEEAKALCRHDPLGTPRDVVSSIAAAVQRIQSSLAATAAEHQRLAGDLAGLRDAVEECGRVLTLARSGREAAAGKVVVPPDAWRSVAQAETDLADLRRRVDDLSAVAEPDPVDTRRRLVGLGQLVGQLRARVDDLAASEDGLATRDELRGRLEAYRARARSLGRAEDLELARLYERARDALYTAPCDLAEAEELVGDFQRALRPGSKEHG